MFFSNCSDKISETISDKIINCSGKIVNMVFIRKRRVKNSVYWYVVANTRVNGKIIQKSMYVGKETDLPSILENCELAKKLVKYDMENLLYQTPVTLWKLLEEMKVQEIFSNYFFKLHGVDAAAAACTMIINYAIDHKSKNQLSYWYGQTYLPHLLKIPTEKMNKDLLCRTMDFFTEEKIEKIHAEIFQVAKEKYQLSDDNLFFDITDITFEGDQCPLAEKGYNSRHEYNPQINLAMATTIERFPVIHKVFEGGTKDVKTLIPAVSLLERFRILDKTVFIIDRGLPSKDNLEFIKSRQAKFICGFPKNNAKKKLISTIGDTDFIRIDDDISYWETKEGEDRLLIFWSKKLQDENKLFREKRIARINQKLLALANSKKKYEPSRIYEKIGEICGKYRKFFEVKTTGEKPQLVFSIKQDSIQLAARTEGKYAILTNTDIKAEDVLKQYRERNFVEMSFKDLKMFIDIRPVRHWKENRVIAHVYFAVLALGLRSILQLKLRRKYPDMTSEEALDKLNTVRALVADGNLLRLTSLTPEIQKIVAAIES